MLPEKLIEKGLKLLSRKGADYCSALSRHENFEHSALVTEWFHHDIDKVYVTLITTKITRLATLLNSNQPPKNESIEDSFVDLVNYCALWGSKRITESKIKEAQVPHSSNSRIITGNEGKVFGPDHISGGLIDSHNWEPKDGM